MKIICITLFQPMTMVTRDQHDDDVLGVRHMAGGSGGDHGEVSS